MAKHFENVIIHKRKIFVLANLMVGNQGFFIYLLLFLFQRLHTYMYLLKIITWSIHSVQ